MPLNPTQNSLVEEFASNNLLPAIEDIFHKCKREDSRQVCSYLILLAIQGNLGTKTYTKLVDDHLGDGKSSLWIKNRLIGFHHLMSQEYNSNHIFVRSILDDQRFFGGTAPDITAWKQNCKQLIIEAYSKKIEACLQKASPDSYNFAICLVQSEQNKKFIKDLSSKTESLSSPRLS